MTILTSGIEKPIEKPIDNEKPSVERFVMANKFFFVPWMILVALLYSMRYVPQLEAHFAAHGMEPLGFASAAKLTVWCILCSYAIHGWIAVNEKELNEQGLKVLKDVKYNFQSGDASIRSSFVFLFGMMAYALVPMRMMLAKTWCMAILEFLMGYVILLVLGDAWFFCCHYSVHSRSAMASGLYKLCHKTHHKWKHPVSFSAYYITSGYHLVQEHVFTIPCMMFLPIPYSAFFFYQYYGVPAAMMQHSGFNLDELRVPFCESLKLGHLLTVCGLGLGYILGSQSTADHDLHHETFFDNYQLSYTYLDRIAGTYRPKRNSAQESLLPVDP